MDGQRLHVCGFQAGPEDLMLLALAVGADAVRAVVHQHVDDLVADALQGIVLEVRFEEVEPRVFDGASGVGVDRFHPQLQ